MKEIGNIASNSCFSGRIVCGDCGSVYGSKVWHSNSKYRRVIWQCNGKFKGEEKCSTPHLYEKDIQRIFLEFVNNLITDRKSITKGLKESLIAIVDNAGLEKERDSLQGECEVIMELMRKMAQENARSEQIQNDYSDKNSGMATRYGKASERLTEVNRDISKRNAKRSELESFFKLLDSREKLQTEFDESLWLGIVDKLKINSVGGFTFVLKDEARYIRKAIPKRVIAPVIGESGGMTWALESKVEDKG